MGTRCATFADRDWEIVSEGKGTDTSANILDLLEVNVRIAIGVTYTKQRMRTDWSNEQGRVRKESGGSVREWWGWKVSVASRTTLRSSGGGRECAQRRGWQIGGLSVYSSADTSQTH